MQDSPVGKHWCQEIVPGFCKKIIANDQRRPKQAVLVCEQASEEGLEYPCSAVDAKLLKHGLLHQVRRLEDV